MAAKILKMKHEHCPATRFIGKKYVSESNWTEWWEKGLFPVLEKMKKLPINDDGYIGATRMVDDSVEYWVGMFFKEDTEVPHGFEYIDIEELKYAIFYLYGNAENGELSGVDSHNICMEELTARNLKQKEDGWCFTRYTGSRYAVPDDSGNVILDYAISIEK